MTLRVRAALVVVVALGIANHAAADDVLDRFQIGGYFRVAARPDFQGGGSRLGYWNLYGRLLNEGSYAALDTRIALLPQRAGEPEPWTMLYMRVEGGSVGNADAALGRLDNFYLSQLYVQAGNVLLDNVTWQLGTLDVYMGQLGLYDMRPAQLFNDTLGLSGRYRTETWDVLVGIGDAGYRLRHEQYDTVITGGGWVRVHPIDSFELGLGGQFYFEPAQGGNRNAPHSTPGVRYEDYVRREVVQRYLEMNPGREDFFSRPIGTSSTSWKAIAYLGFGQLGPLEWTSVFASVRRIHPENYVNETFQGRQYTVFLHDLTDERTEVVAGIESSLKLVPDRFDVVVSALLGHQIDDDNNVSPSDFDRTYWSCVARGQVYLTETFHLLGETSYAEERSHNGNAFRATAASVFANTNGVPDARGLQYGDLNTRRTWQGKFGVLINPTGVGIFTRPSLRLLYGVQYSNQNNAFGNSFVTTLDEFNAFGSPEQHWHHLVALEAEAWF